MSRCTASFKGLYLRLGNIGHGGTLETNFITLLTAHCGELGSALGGGNSIPFFTAHFDVGGTAVGGGALPFGPIAPFLWHLPYLVIPLFTAHCNVLGSTLGGGNSIPFFIAHFDVLGTALGGDALPLGPIAPFLLHLPSRGGAVCGGGGGETLFFLGTGGVPSTLGV